MDRVIFLFVFVDLKDDRLDVWYDYIFYVGGVHGLFRVDRNIFLVFHVICWYCVTVLVYFC